MSNHPALSYQQAEVRGASPIGQVVSLFDTILRDFRRALAALKAGKIEARVNELNHAITVIAYLQSTLDHDRGGAAAKRFDQLYKVTIGMIVAANAKATPEALEGLIDMYTQLRQAWQKAEQKLSASDPQNNLSAAQNNGAIARTARLEKIDLEMPQHHWST